ncbi:MAG: sialate O-acetylesterase [Treponema sp.]|jgi:sialate O-acetylesterase|nr:sialate O-acetylesterase [Treponema sp.]
MEYSALCSTGMIIQRDKALPINGKATALVELCFRGKRYSCQPDGSGLWTITVDPSSAGGPFTLEFKSGDEDIVLSDIYVGDLWLCGGQSNMELPLSRVQCAFPEEWGQTSYPVIHEFRVPQAWDFKGPRAAVNGGVWQKLSRETLGSFSATAYFFAKRYSEAHNIPIGLLNASWGGSPAEAWISEDALQTIFPDKVRAAKIYADDSVCDQAVKENHWSLLQWEQTITALDRGRAGLWEKENLFPTDGWKEITVPCVFNDEGGTLLNFCGVLYLKKTFMVGKAHIGIPLILNLGTIVDSDTVFINGVFIGSTPYRYPPRRYRIPDYLLREGENTIVIRIVCNNGAGEITVGKPFEIENAHIDLKGKWHYAIGAAYLERPPELFLNSKAYGLYNAMIYPLHSFPIKGILFYQAESNDKAPDEYEPLFRTLIADWRALWADPELPFLFVQLPIWGKIEDNTEQSPWARLREAQRKALEIPHTAMAVGLDAGEWNDLHPLDKKTIGERLFLAEEKLLHGADNSSPGPIVDRFDLKGDELILVFNNCGHGLTAHGNSVGLTVVSGGIYHHLNASIKGTNQLCLRLGAIKPEKVLYAWANAPRHRELFNSEGLPALPFSLCLEQTE